LEPALATGALFTCFTVITTCAAGDSRLPSLVTSVKVYWVSAFTSGAVKVGLSTVVELSVIPAGAVQEYVIVFPSGSDEAEPSSVTRTPSSTD